MQRFSICRDRLARFQAAADAARGEKSAGIQRMNELRGDVRDLEDELDELGRSGLRAPDRRARLESRIDALRGELSQAQQAHARGAAHRDHATQMASRLDAYAAAQGIR